MVRLVATLPKSLGVKEGVMLSLKSGNDQRDSGAFGPGEACENLPAEYNDMTMV